MTDRNEAELRRIYPAEDDPAALRVEMSPAGISAPQTSPSSRRTPAHTAEAKRGYTYARVSEDGTRYVPGDYFARLPKSMESVLKL